MATIADLNVKIGVEGVASLEKGLQTASASVADLGKKVDSTSKTYAGSTNTMSKATDRFADATKQAGTTAKSSFSGITNALGGVSGAIAGAFTVGALLQFGTAVMNTTAQFQKMEAVLTNTLGSGSAAQDAMLMIQQYAAKTPYSVAEVTEAYIKLANRGIQPTTDQLTKMGDVAASLGKPIGELNEALLDVSNTERWNELGIKVKANGDQMTGTFKGLTVEVERTEAGALKMVERFGEMNGVAGTTAAVSDTLGGKLNNLGDTFDQFFLTIGNGTDGILSRAVTGLNSYVAAMTTAFKSMNQLNMEAVAKSTQDYLKIVGQPQSLTEFAEAQAYLNDKTNQYRVALAEAQKKLADIRKAQEEAGVINLTGRNFNKEIESQKKVINGFKREIEATGKALQQVKGDKVKFQTPVEPPQVAILEQLNIKLKEQEAIKAGATNEKTISQANQRIEKIKEEIKRLNDLGLARTKFTGPAAQEIRQSLAPPALSTPSPIGADVGMAIPEGFEARLAAITAQFGTASGAVSLFRDSLIDLKVRAENDISTFFADNLAPAIDGVGNALFQAFSGESPGKQFFASLIKMFAQAAAEYGKLTMALGVAKVAIGDFSGIGAIAAGAALIAAAGIATGLASKSASGGKGGMSGGGGSYSAPTNRASSTAVTSGRGALAITGETVVRGNDLVVVFNRATNERGRTH